MTDGIITRHLEWMRLRNLSPLTVSARRCALVRLSEYLDGPVLYATADQLAAWQQHRSRTLAPATRRTELSNVREFYRWAVVEGYRTDDPTVRLPMPRAPRRHPRPIHDGVLREALASADPATAAILALASLAGLRACEIARLDWSEISLDEMPLIYIARGKGDRSRVVPLSPALAEILLALPHRRGPVIPRADGQAGHTTANAVTKRASRYLAGLGITDRLHSGRHRFATAAYRASRDIRAVQEVMGHASPTTTSVYAAAAEGATRDAVIAAGLLVG